MELFSSKNRLISEVRAWDSVELRNPLPGVTEFHVRGHVFGCLRGLNTVDVRLPKQERVRLVLNGIAEPHPVMTQSNWVTLSLRNTSNEEVNDEEGHEQVLSVLHKAYVVGSLSAKKLQSLKPSRTPTAHSPHSP